ncbi:MAG: cellulose synthase operon protein YhjQ/BcsQ, partial [Myxococcota bacterium]
MTAVRVAFVGLKGGTGRTAVVATLSDSLTSASHDVLAIDLDPQNALGTYLGMDPAETVGLVDPMVGTALVREVLETHEASSPYVPFGKAPATEVWRWVSSVADGSIALDERLASLTPPRCELVLHMNRGHAFIARVFVGWSLC